ncbi:MAG: hypothetical protein ACPLYF_01615, partial [Fervidobacterium sp.]
RAVFGALLLATASLFPALRLPQYITGSAVNCILLIATYALDMGGVIIGFLTPWIAVATQQMPFVYMAPFIMVGNAIYCLSFYLLKRYGNLGMIAGIILGAILKFLFLSIAVTKLVFYFFNIRAPPLLIQMMSIPQLVTALVGGFIALLIIKRTRKLIDKLCF